MFLIRKIIYILFVEITATYAGELWPASNYSKSAATYGIGAVDDMVDWSQHPCKRDCKDNEPMTCRYGFTIENYISMSRACFDCPSNMTDCQRPHCVIADGNSRMVIVINRQLPGPSIEVCKGDRIIVDVKNAMKGESTTLHWHGLHQRGTPFMDGVPMVSQCPILVGETFRYDFKADNSGTHWWHSHSGFQRADGVFGSLIVRQPASTNLVGHLYDHDEHIISLIDWNELPSMDNYFMIHHVTVIHPRTILINGLGHNSDNLSKRLIDSGKSSFVPRQIFHVKKGSRYRFRLFNAGNFNCAFIITVDKHSLLVVSSDGADVKPVEVDSIRILSGESYDFVLNANQEVGNYWIRLTSTGDCGLMRAHQEAILRYEGAPNIEPDGPVGFDVGFAPDQRLLNPINQGYETKGAMCVSCSLTSLEPDDPVAIAPTADYQFYLALDVYVFIYDQYFRKNIYNLSDVPSKPTTQQINHLTFESPKFPLQTQPQFIQAQQFCNIAEAKCTYETCSCEHVLEVKLNSTVELIFVQEAVRRRRNSANRVIDHPMHLHGFEFRVVAMERLGNWTTIENVKAWDQAGKIHRKLEGAPLKDTLAVPSGGYAVVRFRADNPGYWFLHCHFDSHMNNGMALVIKVGEHKDFPPVPKALSKCSYQADSLISHTLASGQRSLYSSYSYNVLIALTALIISNLSFIDIILK